MDGALFLESFWSTVNIAHNPQTTEDVESLNVDLLNGKMGKNANHEYEKVWKTKRKYNTS